MNVISLMGRLTRDPEVKFGQSGKAYCRFSVAVNRPFSKDEADFINCVVFGKSAEFTERYFRQGMRVVVCGRIQTGSYTNRDGVKVYTTEVVVEEQEFAESKNASSANTQSYQAAPAPAPSADAGDGFMNIPDGIDEELPFN